MIRRLASLHAVLRCDRVPALHGERSSLKQKPSPLRYYQGAATSRRSSRRASLPSLGGAVDAFVALLPPSGKRARTGHGLFEIRPADAEFNFDGNNRISQVPGEPLLRLRRALRPRQDHGHQTRLRWRDSAPVAETSRAPALQLSRLNTPALALAVYASPRRLPAVDARLASGCWSGSAGRASHPQGSEKRFQKCILTSHPPLPSLLGAIPHSGHRAD
jgi:hypothetical protein